MRKTFMIINNIIFTTIVISAILHTCTPQWTEISAGQVQCKVTVIKYSSFFVLEFEVRW